MTAFQRFVRRFAPYFHYIRHLALPLLVPELPSDFFRKRRSIFRQHSRILDA